VSVGVGALAVLVVRVPGSARASTNVRRIRPGVRLIRIVDPGPVRAFVLEVRPTVATIDVALGAGRFPGYGRTVPQIAREADAIAAVNGDMGLFRPTHPFARDGELVQTVQPHSGLFGISSTEDRAFIGQTALRVRARPQGGPSVAIARWNDGPPRSGKLVGYTAVGGMLEVPPTDVCWILLHAIRPPRLTRDTIGVSRTYGVAEQGCRTPAPALTRDDVVLATLRGDRSLGRLEPIGSVEQVTIRWASGWPGVVDLSGGFPLLVRHSRSVVRHCDTEFCMRQPRTGVGVTAGCVDQTPSTACHVLLAVVDGRREGWSQGVTMSGFARIFLRLGAVAALNMDGGGSSVLMVRGSVVNRPSDHLRRVSTSLVVLRGSDPGESWMSALGLANGCVCPSTPRRWWSTEHGEWRHYVRGGIQMRGHQRLAIVIAVVGGATVLGGTEANARGLEANARGIKCTIIGTNGPDLLIGTEHRDVICGRGGSDVIRSNGGNDRIYGGRGRDALFGGKGDDRIWGGASRDHLDGAGGDDLLVGGTQADRVVGSNGRDSIHGGLGADSADGGNGADVIFGQRGQDLARGGAAADRIFGGPGSDRCLSGVDRVGSDTIDGGPGRDVFSADPGDRLISVEVREICDSGYS
jgi:hypothetical protein